MVGRSCERGVRVAVGFGWAFWGVLGRVNVLGLRWACYYRLVLRWVEGPRLAVEASQSGRSNAGGTADACGSAGIATSLRLL